MGARLFVEDKDNFLKSKNHDEELSIGSFIRKVTLALTDGLMDGPGALHSTEEHTKSRCH